VSCDTAGSPRGIKVLGSAMDGASRLRLAANTACQFYYKCEEIASWSRNARTTRTD
jgi:hypothetical protein